MPIGPGKYGANAQAILEKTDGQLCAVLVVGGRDGDAFDVACEARAFGLMATLPTLLRELATNIEREMGAKAHAES